MKKNALYKYALEQQEE
ncbi:hypothetical protein SEEH0480_09805 [Salmonella enterica subsp. enterica serovar Heidelberg str. 79-0480]|nr:hypothetical protein SEEH4316_27144 [Salmonella enterica subsp. enterica serovar Heidelberg str. RI-11-014316]KJU06168.1 hypothetical protein SEEH0480_09805 [Salmonella enterica subsp. enterica serovar Heidelberg str. 79-0480]